MKKMMMVCALGLGLLVAGCATTPKYAGSWKATDVPADAKEQGLAAVHLHINDGGSFAGSFEADNGNTMGGFSGSWEPKEDGSIGFNIEEGNGPDAGTGTLVDKDTLLGVGDGVALNFKRQNIGDL